MRQLAAGLLLLLLALPLHAEEARLQLDLSWLSGNVVYQIGGKVANSLGGYGLIQFPLSELDFSLDTFAPTISAEWNVWRGLYLSGLLQSNLRCAGDAKLIDSDWGVHFLQGTQGALPTSLDIESESDVDQYVLCMEGAAHYEVLDKGGFSLKLGGGYRRDEFGFVAYDTLQYYPSWPLYMGQPSPVHFIAGDTIEYRALFSWIYPEIRLGWQGGKFAVEGALAGSPLLYSEDEDKHLMRRIISRADGVGFMWRLRLLGRIGLPRNFYLSGRFEYGDGGTAGDQLQIHYPLGGSPGHLTVIEWENSRETFDLALGFGYRF